MQKFTTKRSNVPGFRVTDLLSEEPKTDKSEFKKWLNRGIGAWAILTLVAGFILSEFYRWIESIESTKNTVKQSLVKHSQQIEQLQNQSAAQQVANQGIQRSLTDIDMKIFQLSTRSRAVPKP